MSLYTWDDIVVCSKTLDHTKHLWIVFKVLKENTLYVKREKCSFAQREVCFLGHWIGDGMIWMDKGKVQAIAGWEEPTLVANMRSFLGLVHYYKRFIQGFFRRATPITNLLKKDRKWCWTDECQRAFDDLRRRLWRSQSWFFLIISYQAI